jgi:hypothetical protein
MRNEGEAPPRDDVATAQHRSRRAFEFTGPTDSRGMPPHPFAAQSGAQGGGRQVSVPDANQDVSGLKEELTKMQQTLGEVLQIVKELKERPTNAKFG